MRVVVNDIAASEGGAMAVLTSFYEEILENNDSNEWFFLLGDRYLDDTKNIKVKSYPKIKNSWLKRLMFDLWFGKKIINNLKPDLYISLQNTATIGVKCKQVVYLHQTLPYQKEKKFSIFKSSERKYFVYQYIIGAIYNHLFKKTETLILVQSEWMKKAVNNFVGNDIRIVTPTIPVIIPSLDDRHDEGCIKFFYPASSEIYKNHDIVVEAINKLREKGIENFKVYFTLSPSERYIDENIVNLGKIPREKVLELMQSSVLVFPSYIESYGLPLLEASMCESIILASRTSFSEEILENYGDAYFFDYKNADELSLLMEKVISGDITKQSTKMKCSKESISLYNLFISDFK